VGHDSFSAANCGVAGFRFARSTLRKEILQSVKNLLPDGFWILRTPAIQAD
jgi:hypothetical protein